MGAQPGSVWNRTTKRRLALARYTDKMGVQADWKRLAFCAAGLVTLSGCSPNIANLPGLPQPSATLSPPIANTNPISLTAIQRLDARVGFVTLASTGAGVGLAKTSDGGATWQRIAIYARHVTALRFIDERVGWAVAFVPRNVPQIACQQAAPQGALPCRGVVLRTEDGGLTWQETLSVPTDGVRGDPIGQLQVVDGLRAWVLTLPPSPCALDCPTELLRTTDGGKTWTTLLREGITAMRFASASRGWIAVVGPGGAIEVRVTSDGGSTWTGAFRAGSGPFATLDAATTQTAWIMTRDGAYCTSSNCAKYELFRTDDGGLRWSSLGNPKDSAANCAFGHLVGPLFASVGRGWLALNLGAGGAAGGSGGLLTTDDGGKTWRCAITPPNTNLVSAADPLHVWVTSQERGSGATALYASDDGGTSWHALDLSGVR